MYKQSKTMYLECHSTPIVDILAVNEETNDDDNEPYFNLDNFKIV